MDSHDDPETSDFPMSAFASVSIPNSGFGHSGTRPWGETFAMSPTSIEPLQDMTATSFHAPPDTTLLGATTAASQDPSTAWSDLSTSASNVEPPALPFDLAVDAFDPSFSIFNTSDQQYLSEFLDNFAADDGMFLFENLSPLNISQLGANVANSVLSKETQNVTSSPGFSNTFQFETPLQLSGLTGLSLVNQGDGTTSLGGIPSAGLSQSIQPTLFSPDPMASGIPDLGLSSMNQAAMFGLSPVSLAPNALLPGRLSTMHAEGPGSSSLPMTAADAAHSQSPTSDGIGKRKSTAGYGDLGRQSKRKPSLKVTVEPTPGPADANGALSARSLGSPFLLSDGTMSAGFSPAFASSTSTMDPLTNSKRRPDTKASRKKRELLTEEQKRQNHIISEQRRRNYIGKLYKDLEQYTYSEDGGEPLPAKMSKAILLRDLITYVRRLQHKTQTKQEQLRSLHAEIARRQSSANPDFSFDQV
ncbi:hypothetical protein H4R35_006001 [Dimargaris xerosporica]|nr:hypothetical protein H4R35_006001 [Dimargaris xerosporica]